MFNTKTNKMTTQNLIFETKLNQEEIQRWINLNKPTYEIENRIEKCIVDIEIALRLTKMTKEEAEQLFEIQDDLRELYNEI